MKLKIDVSAYFSFGGNERKSRLRAGRDLQGRGQRWEGSVGWIGILLTFWTGRGSFGL